MNAGPYLAGEDSRLLREALRGRTGRVFVELGTGNAGTLVEIADFFGNAVGTDLARPSMRDWSGRGANFVLADAGSCFREGCADLVAFNPPYLRIGRGVDGAVEGGEDLQVPKQFLRDALRVVNGSGHVVFLLDDSAEAEEFNHLCEEEGFRLKSISRRRVFFEEIAVLEASRELLRPPETGPLGCRETPAGGFGPT